MSEKSPLYIDSSISIRQETIDKISDAADSLYYEGSKRPTNEQVRDKLGGGSLSHISPVMRAWRRQKEFEERQIRIPEVPSDLRYKIESTLNQLWTVAQNLSYVEIDKHEREKERLKNRVMVLERTVHELEKSTTKDPEYSVLKTKIEEQEAMIDLLKDQLFESQENCRNLQSQLVDITKGISNPQ